MSNVPPKYQPDDRQWEDKHWLYEQYWKRQRSIVSIAEDTNVSHQKVKQQLTECGIPRRLDECHDRSRVGLFDGFYRSTDTEPPRKRCGDVTVASTDDELQWGQLQAD